MIEDFEIPERFLNQDIVLSFRGISVKGPQGQAVPLTIGGKLLESLRGSIIMMVQTGDENGNVAIQETLIPKSVIFNAVKIDRAAVKAVGQAELARLTAMMSGRSQA